MEIITCLPLQVTCQCKLIHLRPLYLVFPRQFFSYPRQCQSIVTVHYFSLYVIFEHVRCSQGSAEADISDEHGESGHNICPSREGDL